MKDLQKTSSFSFELPDRLIAQHPTDRRDISRMLILDRCTGAIDHSMIAAFPERLPDDTMIVLNNTHVRRARIFALTASGAQVEVLFIHTDPTDVLIWHVMVSKSKRQQKGKRLILPDSREMTILDDPGRDLRRVSISPPIDESYFEQYGHIPLPPYIKRADIPADTLRYQTVYADRSKTGSVAAPTAGLHLSHEILTALSAKNIPIVPITLHVGMGTFLPIRSDSLGAHIMHREMYEVSEATARSINDHKRLGGRVLAIGTTSVRTLESSAGPDGLVSAGKGSTDLFISPGYQFRCVDRLLTNFHTPESTLLVLVSAFAGYEPIMHAYHEAVTKEYRFFSYGDAMLIL